MALTITGADSTYYEGLWDAGDLLIDGADKIASGGTAFAATDFTVTGATLAIPEPATLSMIASAGALMLLLRRRILKK
jgi:hypothetical protein